MSDVRGDGDPAAPDDLAEVGDRLRRARGRPPAAFRHDLRGTLAGRAPRPRPAGLRRTIACYAGAGAVLLAIGALAAAGTGPFGA